MISIQHVSLADRGWVQVWFDNGYAGFSLEGRITAPKAGLVLWEQSCGIPLRIISMTIIGWRMAWFLHNTVVRTDGVQRKAFSELKVPQKHHAINVENVETWCFIRNSRSQMQRLHKETWNFLCYILTLIWQLVWLATFCPSSTAVYSWYSRLTSFWKLK